MVKKQGNTRHGHNTRIGPTKEYSTWSSMVARCTNPKQKSFKDYGGRGIYVCDRWRVFDNFLEDVGLAPSPQHSIDRVNNEFGYYKENVRWVTHKEQMNNTRRNVWITYGGKTKNMTQWAEQLGIDHRTLWLRLKKFPLEKAMTAGLMQRGTVKDTKKYPNRKKPTKRKK